MTSIETIIDRQIRRWELQQDRLNAATEETGKPGPVIAISRQIGAYGEKIAAELSRLTGFPLVDKEILEAIAKDFGVQKRVVELMDERAQSEFEAWFEGMMTGRIIDSSDYLNALTRTIGAIASYGEMIIMGRGANVILGPEKSFRLRLVASLETRIRRVSEQAGADPDEARTTVTEDDSSRARFLKKSYGVDLDDSSLYDLILNTDHFNIPDAVELTMLGYSKKIKYTG
jgi:cytidylate kinase